MIDVQGSHIELIAFGCLEPEAALLPGDRLVTIHEQVTKLIDEYQPTSVAVEELYFVQNVTTGLKVAEARGVILLAIRQVRLPVAEYKPNLIKATVTGYGHADKRQIQKMIQILFHLDRPPKPDDAADGLAVAITHAVLARNTHANHSNDPQISPEQIPPSHREKILYPKLSYQLVGILQQVSNLTGYQLHERYYYPLIEQALLKEQIAFQKQAPVELHLPSMKGRYFIDYIIDHKIILEIKVGSRVRKQDVDQIMAYLRSTGKELGILAHFSRSGVSIKRFLLGFKT